MSEARVLKHMTPDEFFVWQAEQDVNYELVNGLPVLTPKGMTGASRRHDRITINILSALDQQLRDKPCQPHTDDIAVRNANQNIRRPDIVVDCQSAADSETEAGEPRVVIEVLSPSTMRFDRLIKVEEYKKNPSVRVVLLVASESVEVIVWRLTDGWWQSTNVSGASERVHLPEIDAELALIDVYRGTGLQTIL
jgi:Uma2 family endonuclease